MKKVGLFVCSILTTCALMLASCGDGSNSQVPTTDAHQHVFSEWKTLADATCTEQGEQERVCACGEKENKSIPANGHTDGEWITDADATCAVAGQKHQICAMCSITIQTETIEATGIHTEIKDAAIAPTYTTRGKTEGSHCSVCNSVLIEQRDIATIWNGEFVQPTTIVKINDTYYYEINSAEELAYLTIATAEWQEYNYVLNCDIYLNIDVLEFDEEGNLLNSVDNLREWDGFRCKHFDGNNHTISGVYSVSGGGFISYATSVCNVNVKNSYVYTNNTKSIGGVCNGAYEDITNCSFDGAVIGVGQYGGGTSEGDIVCGVGGIVGYQSIYGILSNCTNYGIVKGVHGVGGIAGVASSIRNCENFGNISGTEIVAGICGFNAWWIGVEGSNNYGTVSGYAYVGGIVGKSTGNSDAGATTSKNFGAVTGETYVGGIIGILLNGRISECTNYAPVIGENYVGGISGYNKHGDINECKVIAVVTGTENVGGVLGYMNIFSDEARITACYYLKDNDNNSTITGIGNIADEPGTCEGKTESFFEGQ